jgi:N-acyl-D-aspartate/D-glutamate deacylase
MLFARLLAAAPLFAQYDVLIVGGRVIDGTGNAWFHADVAVKGDTIVAIGPLPGATAALRIDATGLVVSPGFIDIHSHGRDGIFRWPPAENLIRQGVTTIIEGNDGSSPLPLKPFLEKLGAAGIGVNFGSFVGQGTVRSAVMGLVNRPATPEEIAKMRDLTRQAMLEEPSDFPPACFTSLEISRLR